MSNTALSWDRDENGLVIGLEHPRKSNGKVDWRRMISPEYIVPNRERTEETDISQIEDKNLLILLQGFKDVAQIRGYSSVITDVRATTPSHVLARTLITWNPNFENKVGKDQIAVTSTGSADAHPDNTSGFGSCFLTSIAENRSFVRAVRNFLNIPILGQDELGGSASPTIREETQDNPLDTLLRENKVSWENFKNKMIKLKVEGAPEWESTKDIPKARIFELIETVKNLLAAKAAQKAATT